MDVLRIALDVVEKHSPNIATDKELLSASSALLKLSLATTGQAGFTHSPAMAYQSCQRTRRNMKHSMLTQKKHKKPISWSLSSYFFASSISPVPALVQVSESTSENDCSENEVSTISSPGESLLTVSSYSSTSTDHLERHSEICDSCSHGRLPDHRLRSKSYWSMQSSHESSQLLRQRRNQLFVELTRLLSMDDVRVKKVKSSKVERPFDLTSSLEEPLKSPRRSAMSLIESPNVDIEVVGSKKTSPRRLLLRREAIDQMMEESVPNSPENLTLVKQFRQDIRKTFGSPDAIPVESVEGMSSSKTGSSRRSKESKRRQRSSNKQKKAIDVDNDTQKPTPKQTAPLFTTETPLITPPQIAHTGHFKADHRRTRMSSTVRIDAQTLHSMLSSHDNNSSASLRLKKTSPRMDLDGSQDFDSRRV